MQFQFNFDQRDEPVAVEEPVVLKNAEQHQVISDGSSVGEWLAVEIDTDFTMDIVRTDALQHTDELRDIVTTSDIQTGIYEGGLKLWECAIDLVRYLKATNFTIPSVVMELGCGHGLPGIFTLQQGATQTIFMDYNPQVCTQVTRHNILRNAASQASRAQLFSGDWNAVSQKFKSSLPQAQLILTADTLYTEAVCVKVFEMIRRHLHQSKDSVALIAAKKYYFGTGGSVHFFESLVETDPNLVSTVVWTQEDGQSNIRHIIRLGWIGS